MQLHELKPVHSHGTRKRIGRGGKRGTTSGRGTKGQKSRSGHRIRPAERDLILRLPKLKGIKNRPLTPKPVVLKLSDLVKVKDSNVTLETLKSSGLIRKNYAGEVKILSGGEISKAVNVKGIKVSEGAKSAILKAGGSVIEK